jgi:hypothetical protein
MSIYNSHDYPRIRQKLVASVRERHVDASQVKEMETAVSDLGEGGIFVEMANPPPKGTILEFEFTVPGRTDCTKVLGIVRWGEKAGPNAGVGVRFAPIGESERADIAELITKGTESGPAPIGES